MLTQDDLDTQLSELKLRKRSYNALMSENIYSVRQLMPISDDELLRIRNIGLTTLYDIRWALENYVDQKELDNRIR